MCTWLRCGNNVGAARERRRTCALHAHVEVPQRRQHKRGMRLGLHCTWCTSTRSLCFRRTAFLALIDHDARMRHALGQGATQRYLHIAQAAALTCQVYPTGCVACLARIRTQPASACTEKVAEN